METHAAMTAAATPCSIRLATPHDASAILTCLAQAFEPYREQYTPEAYRDTVLTPETIHDRLSSMSVFVAVTSGGAIIGTIAGHAATAEEGHLRGMAVLPAYHGAGIADQLLQAVEQELRTRGCTRLTLDTTEPLHRAARFYERHGFRASGRVTSFFGMPLFEYVKELR